MFNTIEGNFIGTDRTGTRPLPNNNGVQIGTGASMNTIGAGQVEGGAAAGAGNLISGNRDEGVVIAGREPLDFANGFGSIGSQLTLNGSANPSAVNFNSRMGGISKRPVRFPPAELTSRNSRPTSPSRSRRAPIRPRTDSLSASRRSGRRPSAAREAISDTGESARALPSSSTCTTMRVKDPIPPASSSTAPHPLSPRPTCRAQTSTCTAVMCSRS